MVLPVLLRRTADEVGGFLLGASCAGCDRSGALLCDGCRAALEPQLVYRVSSAGLPIIAAMPFDGVAARVIRRLKEEGDTSLARPLGSALAAAVQQAPPGHLVPVPTRWAAFRRRGFRVPELLVRRAGYVPRRVLVPGRPIADQRELGRAERARNVRGSMRVASARLAGPVIVIDDVTTSGATLDEAARVLAASGFLVRAGIAVAATPSRP